MCERFKKEREGGREGERERADKEQDIGEERSCRKIKSAIYKKAKEDKLSNVIII